MKKHIIYIATLSLLSTSCNLTITDEKLLEQKVFELCEQTYFEGQKDALDGDIRIKLNSDSVYVWTKSPWDNDRNPTFVPTYLDSK